MKKTILFLMNGFGIEQVDSYSVYSKDLMPNLDSYTKNYLFSSIECKYTNLDDGLLYFSTGAKLPLTYSLIDRIYNDFSSSKNFNFYLKNIKPDANIHIYAFIESDRVLEHLKSFTNFLNKNTSSKIFIHCVLTSDNIDNYKEVEKIITRIHYDFNNCKVATIIGEEVLKEENQSSYMNMLKNEVGEKWKELNKKFTSLYNSKVAPRNMKEFIMNESFKLEGNDNFFFFNYEYTNIENFIKNISNITDTNQMYSLFPINGIKYPMLAYPKSGISSLNSLKKINCKALVVSNSKRINKINYYLTGLSNVLSNNLYYIKSDNDFLSNENNLKAIMDDSFDLIIIDYPIDTFATIPEIKDELKKIDDILKVMADYATERDYTLFISSLYGMKKELPYDNFTKYLVDFSTKVPFVVIDKVFKKDNFRIDIGDTYNLAHTAFTSISSKYSNGSVLIKKKGFKLKK